MKEVNKTLFISGLIVVAFGLVALVLWLQKEGVFSRLFIKKANSSIASGSGSRSSGSALPTDTFPLRKGSRGENVKRLQTALNKAIAFLMPARPFLYKGKQLTSIGVDGVFGNETQAAVNWYYMLNKVEVTEAELSQIKGV